MACWPWAWRHTAPATTRACDAALLAAGEAGKGIPGVTGTSAFYRAMSLYRRGRIDEARKLATEAAAKMKPLPADEQNPLAGGADHDDLILWLAYKEAKALIGFDPPPAADGARREMIASRDAVRSPRRVVIASSRGNEPRPGDAPTPGQAAFDRRLPSWRPRSRGLRGTRPPPGSAVGATSLPSTGSRLCLIAAILQEVLGMRGDPDIGQERPRIHVSR